jgi:hypothetical protein
LTSKIASSSSTTADISVAATIAMAVRRRAAALCRWSAVEEEGAMVKALGRYVFGRASLARPQGKFWYWKDARYMMTPDPFEPTPPTCGMRQFNLNECPA